MRSARPRTLEATHVALRILIVGSWLVGVLVLGLLAGLFVAGDWTATALGFEIAPSTRDQVLWSLRAIGVIGILSIPVNVYILRKILSMVDTVRDGDPFVPTNAERLQAIGWAFLAIQVVQLIIGWIAESIPGPSFESDASLTGWLAVLLIFVLARVFAEGARMREDLAGTV